MPDVSWLLEPLSSAERDLVRSQRLKSIDCQIMDVSDDLSYALHDFEDMIALKLISRAEVEEDVPAHLWQPFLETMKRQGNLAQLAHEVWLDELFGPCSKSAIGKLVHYAISSVRASEDSRFNSDLYRLKIDLDPPAGRLVAALKRTVLNRVILSPAVQQIRSKVQAMITDVFSALANDPSHLLPLDVRATWEAAEDESGRMRAITDYVASLTDAGLTRTWRRLHDPTSGTAFDSLR